jgi:hypothetical protein
MLRFLYNLQHIKDKDKVRKVAMCGDQNRIQNSNLLGKIAAAIVARMGDEDEDNEGSYRRSPPAFFRPHHSLHRSYMWERCVVHLK